MELLAMAIVSGLIWAVTPAKTYENVATQTEKADKYCGKGNYTLYNKPVAVTVDGSDAYFICK